MSVLSRMLLWQVEHRINIVYVSLIESEMQLYIAAVKGNIHFTGE